MKNAYGVNCFTGAEGVAKVMDAVEHSQFKDYEISLITLYFYDSIMDTLYYRAVTYMISMRKDKDSPIEHHWFDVAVSDDETSLVAFRTDNIYA